jgi:hypothetical protein
MAALATREADPGVLGVLRLLSKVWARPPGDWAMFVFGVLGSLPLVAFFTRVLIGDSDSARMVASIQYVRHQDWNYLLQTQENYMPHLLIGPILAIGGIAAAKVFTILTVQALAGVVSFVSWKLTGHWVAALGSLLALLSFPGIVERTAFLPMYPMMLALGYAGTYLSYRAIVSQGRTRMILAALAGLCLALSPEVQPVGQVFILLPALLVVGTGVRRALPALFRVYAALAVFLLPRAIINLSEGGLSHILSYRVDFWITKGYLVQIQREFLLYPLRLSYPDYIGTLITRGPRIAGTLGVVVVLLGVAGLVLTRPRLRRFGIVACVFFLAPLLIARAPFASRYFSPLLVGGAWAVGALIAGPIRRPSLASKAVGVGLVVVLGIFAVVNMGSVLREMRGRQKTVLNSPYRELASRIMNGRGVIGARSSNLLFVDPDLRTYGGQFLSESEYVAYLTWPSDDTVIRVMQKHHIGWVLIMTRRWEIRYNNAWLVPAYGKSARQVFAVDASPNFCLELEAPPFRLYKLGCPPREAPESG